MSGRDRSPAGACPSRREVPVLAVGEARRLLLHPVVAGFGVSLVMVLVGVIQGM